MPLFYHKYVNYVLAHSVNYVITLYSSPLPKHRLLSFPPSLPLCPTPRPAPPQFQIRAIGATTILHSSFFIFHHSFSLIAANPALSLCPALSKIEIRAIGATTILHSSFFIFHSPSSPPTPHYPSPRTIKNRNSRHRRNHNSSFFIFHFSFFILHFSKHHPLPSLRPSYQLLSLTF